MSTVVASPSESHIPPQQPHSSSIVAYFRNFFAPQPQSEDKLQHQVKQQLDMARFAMASEDFVLARELIKALIPLVKDSKTLKSLVLSWEDHLENLEVHAIETMQAQLSASGTRSVVGPRWGQQAWSGMY